MRSRIRVSTALPLLAGLALTGCGDTSGPGGVGQVAVELSSDAAAAGSVAGDLHLSAVPAAALGSLMIDVTRIDVHVAGDGVDETTEGAAEGESGWTTLELEVAAPIDLLDLSTTGAVALASGAIPAGRITQIRLFFDTAQLTLDTDTDVGGQTLPAGVYDVSVPSADQTGLKIDQVGVEVGDGETETVTLEVGLAASIGSLSYTTNGFQLSPVLTVR